MTVLGIRLEVGTRVVCHNLFRQLIRQGDTRDTGVLNMEEVGTRLRPDR